MKRFYKEVAAAPMERGLNIMLDGRAAKTPAGAPLAAENAPLMDAIVEEWRAQDETIEPRSMPLTQLLTTVIDLGPSQGASWTDRIVSFCEADLLCYRAEAPTALTERQSSVWDPYLAWADTALGVRLKAGAGIMHVEQPAESLATLRGLLEQTALGPRLALRLLAEATGSAVLALALWRGDFEDDAIFAAARLDEMFQIEQWGRDEEAEARAVAIKADFDSAAAFLRLNMMGDA